MLDREGTEQDSFSIAHVGSRLPFNASAPRLIAGQPRAITPAIDSATSQRAPVLHESPALHDSVCSRPATISDSWSYTISGSTLAGACGVSASWISDRFSNAVFLLLIGLFLAAMFQSSALAPNPRGRGRADHPTLFGPVFCKVMRLGEGWLTATAAVEPLTPAPSVLALSSVRMTLAGTDRPYYPDPSVDRHSVCAMRRETIKRHGNTLMVEVLILSRANADIDIAPATDQYNHRYGPFIPARPRMFSSCPVSTRHRLRGPHGINLGPTGLIVEEPTAMDPLPGAKAVGDG